MRQLNPASAECRRVWSWALFDWANSAFATVIMAGFFPVLFKQFWARDLSITDSTFWLGTVNALASLLVVVSAPLLGALADHLNARRRFLLLFTALGVLASGALYWLGQGQWEWALAWYLLGLLGFSGSNVFYDALLLAVTHPSRYEHVSSLGYALGYLGGGLLFAFSVLMTQQPHWFGLADAAAAARWSFLGVALWWALFTVPLLWWVPEPAGASPPTAGAALRAAIGALRTTWSRIHRLPQTFLLLLAYWLYIDGVDTIVRMAVDYGLALGLAAGDLMGALLLAQFVGFPAALAFGWLGSRWGAQRSILLAIGVYLPIIAAATLLRTATEFYLLAAAIGLVQGGIQSLSRALFAQLTPAGHSAEFFGLFNMVGKFAAVLGPAVVALTAALTDDPRLSLLPIAALFVLGGALLWRVDPVAGRAAALAYAP